ncbi:MAG TPA: glucuronate isomerase [Opitutaceae bacterium]|jgi:glucuronate isomerase|nr:glucuronate isomerase [Opitutaceae bacterium]
MKRFIHEEFLLQSDAAQELYHRYAEGAPIYDYHCHVPQAQIAANHQFGDLAEIWIGGDHYKWRAMRANGVDERFCTGSGSPREKFDAWVATIPHTLGNPLYHWSHLEMTRYFGIHELISPETGASIWDRANAKLPSLRVHDILSANKVAIVCTTDDPADSLDTHERIRESAIKTRVYPAFRPDKALGVSTPVAFNTWVERLAGAARTSVNSFEDFVAALKIRHDDFHVAGCRLSDHGLEEALAEPCTPAEADAIFKAARSGRAVSPAEAAKFGSYLMLEFGRWDAAKGWTKQLHLGAQRSANTRLLKKLGPDTGFDSIGDFQQTRALGRYMDALDVTGELPKMVLYNLNPSDNYAFASMAGNFQDGSVPGKIQFGSGWWFLDQKEAMEWQMSALAHIGLLSRFVGMLSDSRNFLCYTRHEYFRRVMCNMLGAQMERGELPKDAALVGGMVKRICFANARDYFGLELHPDFA